MPDLDAAAPSSHFSYGNMMHSLVLCLAALLHFGHATTYTSDWAIRIRGDMESVNRVAEKYGFTNMGQVRGKQQAATEQRTFALLICIVNFSSVTVMSINTNEHRAA